jgi:hypothetical protein
MRGKLIIKLFVVLILFAPIFSYIGCKKQAKCGCGKDVIRTLTSASANIYFTTEGASVFAMVVGDSYSYYYFCNPTEMFKNLKDAKSGDVLLLSGHAYWDCSYVYQSSNSPYQNYQQIYQIQVTELTQDLYGKK